MNNEFKDSFKLAKEFNVKEFVINYTNLNDYFRSPVIPDNQKVLIALLVMKKRFKSLTVSNSFIAKFLNEKGLYKPIYKEETYIDENAEYKTRNIVAGYEVVHSDIKLVDGVMTEQPLYTKTAVSDAIKKWEKEGVIACSYDYSFNKDMDKPYKFISKRTISFNYDNLRPILTCFQFESTYYKGLPERSRKRKLIRQRPFSILDELKDLLASMTQELKEKYQNAKGIFYDWCYTVSRRYFNSILKNKPTASETRKERTSRLDKLALKQLLDPGRYINQTESQTAQIEGNQTIQAVFNKMVGNE